ncbi:MAG: hypothetical protein QMD43_07225 [Thermodesulfovibrio sp.]|uniref:hypothetical protein n=1 Tax=unclassified Thermodesulfovibrio TaxID=2645936 RepID=UPI000839E44A|nr:MULTISPECIES: hypothetical protein [unclassified Thermodesulfovibrio]MDI1472667.1 hypothetical protein [Thermodesulfovibrio sp. 1176]MDI6714797.1 hypothetical protein [Thermodesulfovibrio sp.]ODA44433.1 hypothetical protein THER_0825 [Thermodesulfovibrio sp. N1]
MKTRFFIICVLFVSILCSEAFCEKTKEFAPSPADPSTQSQQKIGLPAMPDLIIVGRINLDGNPRIGFASACRGECIIAQIKLRIENRGNAPARERFKVSIMQELISPPGAEQEVLTDGIFINGLNRSGVGEFYSNLLVPIYFPLSMAGQKVKVRAIVDSLNSVRESDETRNASKWLEIQLPPVKK